MDILIGKKEGRRRLRLEYFPYTMKNIGLLEKLRKNVIEPNKGEQLLQISLETDNNDE